MGVVSAILQNAIDTIDALTPNVRPDKPFKGIKKASMDSIARVPEGHRAFNVTYSDELAIDDSFPWTTGTNMYVNRVMDFKMILRLKGRNVVEAMKDAAKVEQEPQAEGRTVFIVLAPLAKPKETRPEGEEAVAKAEEE